MQPLRSLIVLALLIPITTVARGQSGTRITDGILDSIEFFADPPTGDQSVVIHLFDASEAELGTGGEGGKPARVEAVARVQKDGPGLLSEAFVAESKKLGTFDPVITAATLADLRSDNIDVTGRFTIMDPGSKAKRFAGSGAGKGMTEIEGTVKDAAGKVLAKFRHRRLIVMSVGRGNYATKMRADCRRLGEDIATFLDSWVKGRKLD